MSFPLGCRKLVSGDMDARGSEAGHGGTIEDARITLLENQIRSSTQRQQLLEVKLEELQKDYNEALVCNEDLQSRLKESLTVQKYFVEQLAGLLGHCATFPFRPEDGPTHQTTTEVTAPLLNLSKKSSVLHPPVRWWHA